MAIVLRPRQQNNQTISIGFSGAAGVGKTTLVKELFSYYKKQGLIVDVINEVARDIFSIYSQTHGVRTLEEMRLIPELYLMFQNDVLEIQITREMRIREKSPELLLLDRTVYDNYLYTLLYCRRSDHSELFDRITKRFYEYLISQPYQQIIYLLPHGTKNYDEFRASEDLNNQEVQDVVLRLLTSFSLDRIKWVTTTSLEERFGYLVFLIDGWLKKKNLLPV
ncbi:MAG TPA: AAA family ATPase [Atribacter sp.]|jgi:GTPase SAR1 family protein|uniref:NadR/Ttd14 AAA domain-containing protein n=1 Tax=Candidatus Atribacter allofermentans TaxID=1852833 RepID=A0A1V5SJQ4_9BACT|nr:AAA family ATPase [Atribacter sp.]MDD3714892.1 AAA family ATPase [Atribacterota bacterium]OQA54463.1 MAG: hypothetical protein BWY41_02062 [Candidatus Atribacteria bacterium ADurb.Bin276]HHT09854.1 AAA family ATPase [Candidatus Atribacteria bacterium]MDI9594207.1 AAA family ATPase [Atribacterota bacterium]HQK83557.1 AAA family ATPase [Atribacter sp.]